ncbi:phosphotransferase [bacterium]|nr:phosphotransferase [bacterium]
MAETPKKILKHGRETYIEEYGRFVIKRPLATLGDAARADWLAKQHRTKDVTDAIRAIQNPVYNIPEMHFVHDGDFQVLEDLAPGMPLTADVYRKLSRRQQYEIVTSLASFLVDMNESQPVGAIQKYNISDELKLSRLSNFVTNKMYRWFSQADVYYMGGLCDAIADFEYETCMAWSHCDLNTGNVLYDKDTSKLWIIDFAEADYRLIYRDIFSPLAIELDIYKRVYETYKTMHDGQLFQMPGVKNGAIRDIMKYRVIVALLRRFIKASDDLRINPANEKSVRNNEEKIAFMRDVMNRIRIQDIQR